MEKSNIKALLLQIRQNESVIAEEKASFARYSGLAPEQIFSFNVFDNPSFDIHLLKNYHCLFVGGASEASVLEPVKYAFVPSLIKLMRDCIDTSYPVFASCFGFQAAVLALGGKITKDTENFEMGTYRMKLSKEAVQDPVFQGVPNGFYAVSVHQEKTTELPPDCTLLASTDACIHAFRATGKPFWAFQFHPELDKPNLVDRLLAYAEKYTEDESHYQAVIDSLESTSDAHRLVSNFIKYLVHNH